jgi:hypothetical protein
MNREMLKEAIAEAKTIKETAIANAKAALEEAFTPQLTAMFAERLNEEDAEDEKLDENYGMEEEGLEETFNLDEILAELSETEETDEAMKADDTMEGIDKDLMLEEMSDEEIEELVMKVIDDMIETGKLMPGEGEEEDMEDMEDMGDMEDMEDMEVEDEEEVELDELLNELLSEEDEKGELKEDGTGTNPIELLQMLLDPAKWEVASNMISRFLATDEGGATVASILGSAASLPFIGPKIKAKFKDVMDRVKAKTNEAADTTEMEETINELRNELNEVNLLNAKLLYTNKIFKAKNLTESEKVKVLNTFDKAETVKEVKLVFETLTESFKATAKKAPIKESLGSASRSIAPAQAKQPIIEVNDAFARMQRLAGLKK